MGKELIWQCYTDDEHESVKLMENRFNSLSRPYALYLEGELGAGKTFLCQQIAKLNGIESLTSSSFLNFTIHSCKSKIIHVDYYYNQTSDDFFFSNIYEEIDDNTIILSEWCPEYFKLNISQFIVKIVLVNESRRKISLYSV